MMQPACPDVPVEALHVTPRMEWFRWRVRLLAGEGGFALVTGAPDTGAPADRFISADTDWMDYLDRRDLIDRTTRVDLFGNTLVLVAAKDDPTRLKLAAGADVAGAAGGERIAVCTIASCPGGKYAKAALTALGIWEATAPKLVDQETVRLALVSVARGEAKFAIVYATDAAIEPRVRVVDTFPAGSHPPIVYPAAVTRQSPHPDARAFLAYLRGPAGLAVFRKHGFAAATK